MGCRMELGFGLIEQTNREEHDAMGQNFRDNDNTFNIGTIVEMLASHKPGDPEIIDPLLAHAYEQGSAQELITILVGMSYEKAEAIARFGLYRVAPNFPDKTREVF